MFLLYAIAIGLILGVLTGGRPEGLAHLQLRWAPLAIAGFAAQVILFAGPVSDRVGDAGPPLYVASTALVLVAVARNIRLAGLPIVVLGAVSNVTAIVANGGFMPASATALDALGRTHPGSVLVEDVAAYVDKFVAHGRCPADEAPWA